MGFNQESIHNADSWLRYCGQQQTIRLNKLASIWASPRVAARSIIRPHEAPLDNEPADAPLAGAAVDIAIRSFYDLKIGVRFNRLSPDIFFHRVEFNTEHDENCN